MTHGLIHMDQQEKDTWANRGRTRGNVGKYVSKLKVTRGSVQNDTWPYTSSPRGRPLCDTCCPTHHLSTSQKPREVSTCHGGQHC